MEKVSTQLIMGCEREYMRPTGVKSRAQGCLGIWEAQGRPCVSWGNAACRAGPALGLPGIPPPQALCVLLNDHQGEKRD